MNEERFYCPTCKVPVDYQLEIERYTCSRCEKVLSRREIITEQQLSLNKDCRTVRIRQPSMGEFL